MYILNPSYLVSFVTFVVNLFNYGGGRKFHGFTLP